MAFCRITIPMLAKVSKTHVQLSRTLSSIVNDKEGCCQFLDRRTDSARHQHVCNGLSLLCRRSCSISSTTVSPMAMKRYNYDANSCVSHRQRLCSWVLVHSRHMCSKPPDKETKADPVSQRPFFYTNKAPRIDEVEAEDKYCLTKEHLASLPSKKTRSAYSTAETTVTYWKKDVKKKALEIHGTEENLARERNMRRSHNQGINTPQRGWKEFWRDPRNFHFHPGEITTMVAIGANMLCFGFKVAAHVYMDYTSCGLFSECSHSMADLLNQLLLLHAVRTSHMPPDKHHPYGRANVRYIFSLISALCIFFGGSCVNVQHAYQTFLNPVLVNEPFSGAGVIFGCALIETASLLVASNEMRKQANLRGLTFFQFLKENENPTTTVVLVEDGLAVVGNMVACAGLLASYLSGSCMYDIVGGASVGLFMGISSLGLAYINIHQLSGVGMRETEEEAITDQLQNDPVISAVHDVKTTNLGGWFKYKAEVTYDGKTIAGIYLNKQDKDVLYKSLEQSVKTPDDLIEYLSDHGEKMVDEAGNQINRLEKNIKERHPKVRHVDLEQN